MSTTRPGPERHRGVLVATSALALAASLAATASPAAMAAMAPMAAPAGASQTAGSAPSATSNTEATARATAFRNTTIRTGLIRPIKPRDLITPKRLLKPHRYELVNTASTLRADVMWASTTPTAGVFLWRDNSSGSQEFRMLKSPGGYMRLQAVHSGQCLMLDWRGGSYVNGTPVVQHPDCRQGYAPGEWILRDIPMKPCTQGPPYYCGFPVGRRMLVNRQTGRCLDAANGAGGRPPERAVLQQWDCVPRDDAWNVGNQEWSFVDLDAPPPAPVH